MTLASNGLENSVPYKWTYADATARTTDTGFTADDVGKFALQLDTGSLYRLTATTPTWQLAAGTGDMLSTNNLSDVANVATARTNLGLGTAATHDVPATGDASATQVPLGNDSRLSDDRTPTAHATSHEIGGSDAFTGIVPGSAFAPAGLTGATAASRYVGATASGAPASGTFAMGDFVIDQTGKVWICTTAGSPGTWTQITSAGGGGGAMTQIGRTVLGAAAATITFSSIPGTYSDLLLVWQLTGASTSTVRLRFNGDTAANYNWAFLDQENGSMFGGESYGDTSINLRDATTNATSGTTTIANYAGTTFQKDVVSSSAPNYGNSTTGSRVQNEAGRWKSTAAITSITLFLASGGNFAAGSVVSLYGLG